MIVKYKSKILTIDDRLSEGDAFEYNYKYAPGEIVVCRNEDKLNGTHEAHNNSAS